MRVKTRRGEFDYYGFKEHVRFTHEEQRAVFTQRDDSRVIQQWAVNQQALYDGKPEWYAALIDKIYSDEKTFYDNLRDKFIANNIGLAMAQSLRYQRSMHLDESPDDLLPIAEIELVRAFDHFDISQGTRFSTAYCVFARNAFIKYSRIKRRHAPNFPRSSNSLDATLNRRDRTRCDSFVHRGNPGVDEIFKKDDSRGVSALVHEALGCLAPRERFVIESRFGLNGFKGRSLTLKATGELMKITCEYVRRIESRAMKKLREEYPARRAARALNLVD